MTASPCVCRHRVLICSFLSWPIQKDWISDCIDGELEDVDGDVGVESSLEHLDGPTFNVKAELLGTFREGEVEVEGATWDRFEVCRILLVERPGLSEAVARMRLFEMALAVEEDLAFLRWPFGLWSKDSRMDRGLSLKALLSAETIFFFLGAGNLVCTGNCFSGRGDEVSSAST